MARLDGKVALITGAGTGIGRATARAMAAEGAKVVVAEIYAEAGEQTAQIVAQAGGDCIAVATDVTQEDSVRAAIDAAVRHYGGCPPAVLVKLARRCRCAPDSGVAFEDRIALLPGAAQRVLTHR